MKKTVKAIVLPLVTENSNQNEILQEVLSRLPKSSWEARSCGSTEAELAYMVRRAKVMDVELDEFDLI